MAWAKPNHSKGKIDRAGHDLITLRPDNPLRDVAIEIVDNWRSCHAYPLQVIKMTLQNRAKRLSSSAIIAQRLKRRPSIEVKLLQNEKMNLSQMQDLGGCRAIMPNMKLVKSLVRDYRSEQIKSGKATDRSYCERFDAFDYIKHPKEDGYRGVHLIMRFTSASAERCIYNGQRIEIQIRSQLQHAWATAVETAQIFTGQALKSKVKNAHEDWLRFFALTSAAFAITEKSPLVPATPDELTGIVKELNAITQRAHIISLLRQWNDSLDLIDKKARPTARLFILKLDPTAKELSVFQYEHKQTEMAHLKYVELESQAEKNPNVNVVLVSSDSFAGLRKAYPNYYLDTAGFLGAIQKILSKS